MQEQFGRVVNLRQLVEVSEPVLDLGAGSGPAWALELKPLIRDLKLLFRGRRAKLVNFAVSRLVTRRADICF